MDQTEKSMLIAWIFVMIVVLSILAIVVLGCLVRSIAESRSMHTWPSPMPWVPFTKDFDYEKKFYDVKLPSGAVVKHCWPNAGFMYDINGSCTKFSPEDNIKIRLSTDHPEDT